MDVSKRTDYHGDSLPSQTVTAAVGSGSHFLQHLSLQPGKGKTWQLRLTLIWPSLRFFIVSTATTGLGILQAGLLCPLESPTGQTEGLHPISVPLRDKAAEAQNPQQKCELLSPTWS